MFYCSTVTLTLDPERLLPYKAFERFLYLACHTICKCNHVKALFEIERLEVDAVSAIRSASNGDILAIKHLWVTLAHIHRIGLGEREMIIITTNTIIWNIVAENADVILTKFQVSISEHLHLQVDCQIRIILHRRRPPVKGYPHSD